MAGALALISVIKKRDYADYVLIAAAAVPICFLLVASGKGIWYLFAR